MKSIGFRRYFSVFLLCGGGGVGWEQSGEWGVGGGAV